MIMSKNQGMQMENRYIYFLHRYKCEIAVLWVITSWFITLSENYYNAISCSASTSLLCILAIRANNIIAIHYIHSSIAKRVEIVMLVNFAFS